MCDVLSTAAPIKNLLNAVLVLFLDVSFWSLSYSGVSDYWYDETFHILHSLNFCI